MVILKLQQAANTKQQRQITFSKALPKTKSQAKFQQQCKKSLEDSSITSDISEKYRDVEAEIERIQQSIHKLLSAYLLAIQKERPLYQINLLVDMLARNKENLKRANETYADFRRQLKKFEGNYEHLKATNAFY